MRTDQQAGRGAVTGVPEAAVPAAGDGSVAAVTVRDLVKVYRRPGGGSLRAVDGVSFEVAQGEVFGLLGPNGAGKTTTLEIIEGIRKPTAGQVRVLGADPARDPGHVKRVIGVQLQAASYFSLLTIEEILQLFGSFYPRRRPPAELLDLVGLRDKRKSYVRQLSGGQQRRFSVAAALVNDPQVIFLDEPTTGLDPQVRRSLWELITRLGRDGGKTIILTTHYLEEAELLAGRAAIIDHGQIQVLDTPRRLIARLDGAGRIQFTARGAIEEDELRRLPAVLDVAARDDGGARETIGSYQLRVADPRAAVSALLEWARRRDADLRGLEVLPGTLEDIFLQLTGQQLRD